jgi:hypothetical protein
MNQRHGKHHESIGLPHVEGSKSNKVFPGAALQFQQNFQTLFASDKNRRKKNHPEAMLWGKQNHMEWSQDRLID